MHVVINRGQNHSVLYRQNILHLPFEPGAKGTKSERLSFIESFVDAGSFTNVSTERFPNARGPHSIPPLLRATILT